MHKPKIILVIALLLVVAIIWPVFAQGPTLNIEDLRVEEAAYPNMSATVSVVNQSGVPIAGLTADDFAIQEDGQPIQLTGVNAYTDTGKAIAVALVLDLSGSAPLPDVQAAANQFLDSLGQDDLVALIGFNEHMASLDDVDPFREVNFTNNKDSIRSTINNWGPEVIMPKSAVYEAVYKGVLFTSKQITNRRAVIVMTDGADTELGNKCQPYSRPEVATSDSSKAAARDKRVPVFTVGIFNPDPTYCQNRAYLQSLSSETGGEYQEAANAADIGPLFVRVGNRLRLQYSLNFKTDTKRDGKDHIISIRVTTPDGQGTVEQTATYPGSPSVPEILSIQREVNGELQKLSPDMELRGKELIAPDIDAKNNIAKVTYFVNGEIAQEILVDSVTNFTHHPWEWEWNTAGLEVGEYQLKVVVSDEAAAESAPFEQSVRVAECNFVCQLQEATGLSVMTLLIIAAILLLVLGTIIFLISRKAKQEPAPVSGAVYEPPTQSGWAPPPAAPGGVGAPTASGTPYGPPPAAGASSAPASPPVNPTVNVGAAGFAGPVGGGAAAPPPDKTMILRKKPEAFGMLVITNGRHAGQQFRLEDGATIGRANNNLIVVDDGAASGQHAKIRLDGKTFVLHDLGSTNGTTVNGQEITRQHLKDGDQVEIGETRFVFKQVETG